MAYFEWICQECKIYWEREYPVGGAPKRTKCPECKSLSHRYWQNQGVNISFCDDGVGNRNNGANDFHTVKRRYQKHAEEGFDRDSGNRFLRRSIKETEERIDSEAGKYKSMNMDWDKLAEDRGARKLSETEAKGKVENAKKLTEDAYNKANNMGYKDINKTHLDITKPQKQQ